MSLYYLFNQSLFRVTSPIDGKSLSGISSIRVTQPRDCKGEGHRLLRWTELFILRAEEASGRSSASTRAEDNGDVTRFAEGVAKATSMALALKLSQLDPHTLVGLRVSLDGDSVSFFVLIAMKLALSLSPRRTNLNNSTAAIKSYRFPVELSVSNYIPLQS